MGSVRFSYSTLFRSGVFAVSDVLAHESGLLTVTVMGMWLANSKNVAIEDILNFKESLTLLLIAGLFIILAARMDIEPLIEIGWRSEEHTSELQSREN